MMVPIILAVVALDIPATIIGAIVQGKFLGLLTKIPFFSGPAVFIELCT